MSRPYTRFIKSSADGLVQYYVEVDHPGSEWAQSLDERNCTSIWNGLNIDWMRLSEQKVMLADIHSDKGPKHPQRKAVDELFNFLGTIQSLADKENNPRHPVVWFERRNQPAAATEPVPEAPIPPTEVHQEVPPATLADNSSSLPRMYAQINSGSLAGSTISMYAGIAIRRAASAERISAAKTEVIAKQNAEIAELKKKLEAVGHGRVEDGYLAVDGDYEEYGFHDDDDSGEDPLQKCLNFFAQDPVTTEPRLYRCFRVPVETTTSFRVVDKKEGT